LALVDTHKVHQEVNNNKKVPKVVNNSVDSNHWEFHPSVSHHKSSPPFNNNNSSPNNRQANNNNKELDNNNSNQLAVMPANKALNNKVANKLLDNNNHNSKVFHNSHQASVDSQDSADTQDSVDQFLHSEEDSVPIHSSHHSQVQLALDSQELSQAQLPHSEEDLVDHLQVVSEAASEVASVASQASDQLDSVVHQSALQLADTQALSLHTTHSLVVQVESMAHTQDSPSEVSNKQDNNKEDSNSNNNKVVLVKPVNNKPINKNIILPWDEKKETNKNTNK